MRLEEERSHLEVQQEWEYHPLISSCRYIKVQKQKMLAIPRDMISALKPHGVMIRKYELGTCHDLYFMLLMAE